MIVIIRYPIATLHMLFLLLSLSIKLATINQTGTKVNVAVIFNVYVLCLYDIFIYILFIILTLIAGQCIKTGNTIPLNNANRCSHELYGCRKSAAYYEIIAAVQSLYFPAPGGEGMGSGLPRSYPSCHVIIYLPKIFFDSTAMSKVYI